MLYGRPGSVGGRGETEASVHEALCLQPYPNSQHAGESVSMKPGPRGDEPSELASTEDAGHPLQTGRQWSRPGAPAHSPQLLPWPRRRPPTEAAPQAGGWCFLFSLPKTALYTLISLCVWRVSRILIRKISGLEAARVPFVSKETVMD